MEYNKAEYVKIEEEFGHFLDENHGDYSGSDDVLTLDLLEQYFDLLDESERTRETMYESDLEWISNLGHSPEYEFEATRSLLFNEAIEEWTEEQLKQVPELQAKFKIKRVDRGVVEAL